MKDWLKERFATCYDGVSSARPPEYLPETQLAWGRNITVRGGNPQTRPAIVQLGYLPSGRYQGGSFFDRAGGIMVMSIGGRPYRVSLGARDTFAAASIPLPFANSPALDRAYFCATPSALVIQDGQSRPIIYDGSSARRSDKKKVEVPIGTHMAFGNGRLLVAVNGGREVAAGDITGTELGSELKFTELSFLLGGGTFSFPNGVTAMAFLPRVDSNTGFGAAFIFGRNAADAVHVEITSRDRWQQTDGFQTSLFTTVGALGQVVAVNQDLYWRSASGDIRSFRQVVSDLSGPGSTPISLEVARLLANDSPQLLERSSAIYFDNRLLMTAAPRLQNGQVVFDRLAALDFATIATMRGKTEPAYDGEWLGGSIRQLITGTFGGRERAFAILADANDRNILAEITTSRTSDVRLSTIYPEVVRTTTPITASIESRSFAFGDADRKKRLERLDLFVSGVRGTAYAWVQWRKDGDEKWRDWDSFKFEESDPDAENVPYGWQRKQPGYATQQGTLTIPEGIENEEANHVGCLFQIRIEWQGRLRVDRLRLFASMLDESAFAERTAEVSSSEAYTDHDGTDYADKSGNLYTLTS